MKALATILTIGTSLALLAPAVHATGAGLPQSPRAVQFLVLGGAAAGSKPARTITGSKKTRTPVSPYHFQILRNRY
jgi:hypothetical protein